MANIFFNIKVNWPTITDDIRVSVFSPLDLNTPIASVQQNAPHIDQQYSFPGLPRMNFVYKVLRTEINGSTVISQLGQASFVAANDELEYKKPVLIQVGVTNIPGTNMPWPANVSSVTVPDWLGWELEASGRPGQYPFKRDEVNQVDITWDKDSTILELNTLGDIFQDQEYLYFEFQPRITQSSGGIPGTTGTSGFSSILVVNVDTVLTGADIGKKILIDPDTDYLEITLPDYADVSANAITYFEMVSSAAKCANIKTAAGNTIAWLETITNLYICPNESFELYKRVVSTGVYEWRVQNAVGNFLDAGEFVFIDMATDKIFNMIKADGSNCDYLKYARLYNRRVLRNGDGITYSSWSSANVFTRVKFSQKDTVSANFRIPDLNTSPMYLRPHGVNAVQDFVPQKLLQHQHMQTIGALPAPPFSKTNAALQHANIGKYNGTADGAYDLTSRAVAFDSATGLWSYVDGSENNPNSRATICYIKF